mmetsp:Transcript_3891/g.6854  ORF Transcript_3891/g.6854 Transcript_3891/m.6854 type:complete len:84 (-) Transcript_3891:341-592(-)
MILFQVFFSFLVQSPFYVSETKEESTAHSQAFKHENEEVGQPTSFHSSIIPVLRLIVALLPSLGNQTLSSGKAATQHPCPVLR